MAAQIYLGARPIAVAVNEIKTHTVFTRYDPHVVSIHAEVNAIIKARCSVGHGVLYVARFGGDTSMPCKHCMALIIEAGIHSVVYTLHGEVVKEIL